MKKDERLGVFELKGEYKTHEHVARHSWEHSTQLVSTCFPPLFYCLSSHKGVWGLAMCTESAFSPAVVFFSFLAVFLRERLYPVPPPLATSEPHIPTMKVRRGRKLIAASLSAVLIIYCQLRIAPPWCSRLQKLPLRKRGEVSKAWEDFKADDYISTWVHDPKWKTQVTAKSKRLSRKGYIKSQYYYIWGAQDGTLLPVPTTIIGSSLCRSLCWKIPALVQMGCPC